MEIKEKQCSVLVIGGCGFLGQHVISYLEKYADHVTEIRVFDQTHYQNKTDIPITKDIKTFVGDIFDEVVLQEACTGAHCVIHLASIMDLSCIPDVEFSWKINVEGTKSVINACMKTGVRRLIYGGSTAAVTSLNNIFDGTEDSVPVPKKHLNTAYGPTKLAAETLVLQANCDQLQTVSLRPCILYGELNDRFIGIRVLKNMFKGKYIPELHDMTGEEWAYVGNVAWAYIRAETVLHETDGKNVAGEVFFIGDDTPKIKVAGYNSHLEMCFEEAGLKPIIPLCLYRKFLTFFYFVFYLVCWVRINVFKTSKQIDIWTIWPHSMQHVALFSWEKANRVLDYSPIFTFEESRQRTIEYIRSILE